MTINHSTKIHGGSEGNTRGKLQPQMPTLKINTQKN